MLPIQMSLSVVYFTTLSASQIVWLWRKDLMKLIGRHLEENDRFLMKEIATIPAYVCAYND
jgi:hypothetical protein